MKRVMEKEKRLHPVQIFIQVILCGAVVFIAFQPHVFEEWLGSLFTARGMVFVPPSELFSGLYIGIALTWVLDMVFRFKGFLEFTKMIFSITILQYILSTALVVNTDLERMVQNVFRGLIIFGFTAQIIGIVVMMVNWIISDGNGLPVCKMN